MKFEALFISFGIGIPNIPKTDLNLGQTVNCTNFGYFTLCLFRSRKITYPQQTFLASRKLNSMALISFGPADIDVDESTEDI